MTRRNPGEALPGGRVARANRARLLPGDKANAGDLPIQQLSRFGLMVNLKTAKAIGLAVPQSLLVRADKVIE